MPLFQFTSTRTVEAATENEAWEIFADNSWDFAAEAECREIEEQDLITDP